uniref:Cytochrome P450 n=1 Tax=Oryza meridionalis TaxID=40149 RepID=A0A0E0DW82_9ORYZ
MEPRLPVVGISTSPPSMPGVVHHRSRRRCCLHSPKPSSSPHPSPARARRRTAATTHSQVGCAGAAYEADTIGAFGKLWGKPAVFCHDRMPMFGRGHVMAEGDKWGRPRCIVAPAFSATNLNDMIGVMEETTSKMLGEWSDMVALGHSCIDIEKGVVRNAAEIIAKASFSITAAATTVFHKAAGDAVPLHARVSSALLYIRATYEAWKLGRKIDALLLDIIKSRRRRQENETTTDLLSLLLVGNEASAAAERKLTMALALSWTLLMLAMHPEWQAAMREEVTGWSGPMDAATMGKFTKMGCMLNEVLRLYPSSPNVQRPAACIADAEVVRGERRNAAWGLGISASQGREGESADTPSAAALALIRSPPPPLQHPSTSCPPPPWPKGKRKERDKGERGRGGRRIRER